MSPGYLEDPEAQEALRASEKSRRARIAYAFEQLLRASWGRELAYHLVFEMGRSLALSFEPSIKDGVTAAMHMSRNEGIREFGIGLAVYLQDEFPDQWLLMQSEAVSRQQAERAARRQVLERSASTESSS